MALLHPQLLHPMTMLSIVLKSGLFSSNTQLGVIEFVHWGVKQLTHGMAIVFIKLNALTHYAHSRY